jgi:asparagine N-glycosylation enzyme membrane subunit Stt3
MLASVLGRLRAIRRIAWERAIAVVAVLVAIMALEGLRAVSLFAVVVAILLAVVIVESVRLRDLRHDLAAAGH